MGRFSPTVLPERENKFGDFVNDLGEGVVNYATARRLKQGGEREQERLELAKKGQADNLELQKAQNALEEARWQQSQAQQLARLGVQGIVPEEQSGTRAPVMFGGRKTVVPDLGVGIGQQDVTKFTPNKGSFTVGGGYAYDPGRDVSRVQQQDLADRSIAQKQQEQAKQRAALIARGYSEADADLIVVGGVGAEKVGPLAAEGEERDIKRYKATVLARELMEQSGANTRDANNPTGRVSADGLTPYQAAQLQRQDAQFQETRDKNDLEAAEKLWKRDPIMNRPRTADDSTKMQTSDSMVGAVAKRRASRPYSPLFGSPSAPGALGGVGGRNTPPGGGGPVPADSAGRFAPAQGGAKPPARQRAEALRKAGYNKDQIRQQLEHEGYALK
jgi:hypothetical protein